MIQIFNTIEQYKYLTSELFKLSYLFTMLQKYVKTSRKQCRSLYQQISVTFILLTF